MKIKCDKFGKSCHYLTEGKAYETLDDGDTYSVVEIIDDEGDKLAIFIECCDHIGAKWETVEVEE